MNSSRKALKRYRGDLIDLDYYKVANTLLSKDVIEESEHKKIKLSAVSDSAKMDALLDLLDTSFSNSSDSSFHNFVEAIEKQNQILAKKLLQDMTQDQSPNVGDNPSAVEINIAQNIFDEDDDLVLLSAESGDTSVLDLGRKPNISLNAECSDGSNSLASQDMFANLTSPISTSTLTNSTQSTAMSEIKCFRAALEHQKTARMNFKFCIEVAWIQSIDTFSYYHGKNLGYNSCLAKIGNRVCKKKVEKDGEFYVCKENHRTASCGFVLLLKVVFRDSTGEMELTLFGNDVEKMTGMKSEPLMKLNHEGLAQVIRDSTRNVYFLEVVSRRVQKPNNYRGCTQAQMHSLRYRSTPEIVIGWDNVATFNKDPLKMGSGIF